VAVFVKANVTTQAVPEMVPPDAAVSTSCPVTCVHAPTIPRRLDVDVTVKLAASAVCEPVRPVIVTDDPVGKSQIAVNVTVNVLVTPDIGVLCWIVLVLKIGTTTKRGLAPFNTPYTFVLDAVIATDAKICVPDASMLIVGEACAEDGFVISKENV